MSGSLMSEKWPVSSSLTILGKRMKQVLLSIEDDAYEKLMGMLSLCPCVKVESVDMTDTERDCDTCVKYAINTLRNNGVFRHAYDYTWIMMAINQGLIEDLDAFRSPQAFIDYLAELGIDKLPTRFSISLAFSKTLDTYPEWTFIDVSDACEILRRKNVVKQFLSAYGVAKRGIFNSIFNK